MKCIIHTSDGNLVKLRYIGHYLLIFFHSATWNPFIFRMPEYTFDKRFNLKLIIEQLIIDACKLNPIKNVWELHLLCIGAHHGQDMDQADWMDSR